MADIIILTAKFGNGHFSAAKNVLSAFQQMASAPSVEMLDPFEMTHPSSYKHLRSLYRRIMHRHPHIWHAFYLFTEHVRYGEWALQSNRAMRRFFRSLMETYHPRAIVTTYLAFPGVLTDIYGFPPARPFRLYNVITDSGPIHRTWLRGHCDYYFVADSLTARYLEKSGIPPERYAMSGFPTPLAFQSINPAEGPSRSSEDDRLHILLISELPTGVICMLLQQLGQRRDLRITLALGDRPRVVRDVKAFAEQLPCDIDVQGFIPGVSAQMPGCDLLIAKAGGATVHEALAAGCPILVSPVTPGQEEGNALLIQSFGMGLVARSSKELLRLLQFLDRVDFSVLPSMRRNIQQFRNPGGALHIAEKVIRDLSVVNGKNS